MQLKVANRTISKYNNIAVSLKYDSVESGCAMSVYFDPANNEDRKLFVPGNYNNFQLIHNGETLITGVLLTDNTKSSPVKHLRRIGGYSKSGVLYDCQNPITSPFQFDNNPTIYEIASKILTPFGLSVTVDDIATADANAIIPSQTIDPVDMNIKDFLSKLCISKNIVLSHDTTGNLLLTRANTNKTPIFNFTDGMPNTSMTLNFDGQQMHSTITVVGQANIGTNNSSQDTVTNPYVQTHLDWMGTARLSTLGKPGVAYQTGFRPRVSVQSAGNDNNTKLTARQLLSQELKAIRLTIEIDRWELNGKIVRPNNIITVTSPENHLYQKSRWFIESVDFKGDEKSETAVLNCVLPECYNNDTVKNVFTGTNLTVPYSETGAHATITPFDQQ